MSSIFFAAEAEENFEYNYYLLTFQLSHFKLLLTFQKKYDIMYSELKNCGASSLLSTVFLKTAFMKWEDRLKFEFRDLFSVKKEDKFVFDYALELEHVSFLQIFLIIIVSLILIVLTAFSLRLFESTITPKLIFNDFKLINTAFAKEADLVAEKITKTNTEITLEPSQKYSLKIEFKNIGSKTWKKDNIFLNIKSSAQKFRDKSWIDKYSAALINPESAASGKTAYFNLTILAPKEPGTYSAGFLLEDIKGNNVLNSDFDLKIKVAKASKTDIVPKNSNASLSAIKLLQSAQEIKTNPNGTVEIRVGFKNNGTKTWKKDELFLNAKPSAQNFRHSSWVDKYSVCLMKPDTVKPGEIGFFNFIVQASAVGEFNAEFVLEDLKGTDTLGGDFILPIIVNDLAPVSETPANITQPTDTQPITPAPDNFTASMAEPLLRVGLYYSDEPFLITANGQYNILDNTKRVLATIEANQISTVTYSRTGNTYTINSPVLNTVSSAYLIFQPVLPSTIMEIENYENRPSWNSSINYNRFRGSLEIRYAQSTNRIWVINELLMEDYLKGMKETSNISPIEFLKTMTVAARTYATYHFKRATKHQNENFHVDATYDQVYKGYSSEETLPNLAIAVDQTRGIIATYNHEPIVAAYFSRSDGRTRSCQEVWGVNYPYLLSVPTKYTAGMTLWGHGVGLDATDALFQSSRENKTYDQILKYFYTGVEIEKFY